MTLDGDQKPGSKTDSLPTNLVSDVVNLVVANPWKNFLLATLIFATPEPLETEPSVA